MWRRVSCNGYSCERSSGLKTTFDQKWPGKLMQNGNVVPFVPLVVPGMSSRFWYHLDLYIATVGLIKNFFEVQQHIEVTSRQRETSAIQQNHRTKTNRRKTSTRHRNARSRTRLSGLRFGTSCESGSVKEAQYLYSLPKKMEIAKHACEPR